MKPGLQGSMLSEIWKESSEFAENELWILSDNDIDSNCRCVIWKLLAMNHELKLAKPTLSNMAGFIKTPFNIQYC